MATCCGHDEDLHVPGVAQRHVDADHGSSIGVTVTAGNPAGRHHRRLGGGDLASHVDGHHADLGGARRGGPGHGEAVRDEARRRSRHVTGAAPFEELVDSPMAATSV